MANDYCALGYSIVAGHEVMLPLYAVIVWVTIGNGFRYGQVYMILASVLAQVTLLCVFAFSPHWRGEPVLIATLSLTALAIPIYASALLRRIELAKEAAEKANISKSRFLAHASHDLRQPLHAISLFLVSLKQTDLRPAQEQIVERIERAMQGVSQLFRSLLDLSMLESGALRQRREPLALREVLGEIVQQNMQAAARNGCELRMAETQRIVLADRALLTTIVQNLVSNAIKFSPGGAILVGCRLRAGAAAVEVWDTGEGIDSVHLPFVFDETYQVRKRGDRDMQGAGLGLAIVKRTAALMGCDVCVRSRVGRGSCFAVNGLALLARDTVRAPLQTHTPLSPLQGLRVLLIEDDPDILASTADLMKSWGCVVTAALGMPRNAAGEWDVIVADHDLGAGVVGAECVSAVRRASGRDIPAIMITGAEESGIEAECAALRLSVLKKPLSPAELRSAISALKIAMKQFG
jgi:signal transduction histidine kinase/CheY-like chemotaxis protein